MRLSLAFALALAFVMTMGCAAKKSAVKKPGTVENKQNDLDKDKSERNNDSRDDKDDEPKRGGDPCDGGE